MLRLQRYLLGELLASFLLVLLLATGVFLAGSLLQFLQKFPSVSAMALAESVPLFLALALPVTMPLSFLVACLLTYGRFADDNEFLAFQMGGLSPRHAVMPAICAGVALSIATVALCVDVNPMLTSAKKAILRREIREQVAYMRSPSVTNVRIEGMEMSWDGRDGDWYLKPVITWKAESSSADGAKKPRRQTPIVADRATVKLTDEKPMRLVITFEGEKFPIDAGNSLTTHNAKRSVIVIDVDEDPTLRDPKGPDEMRGSELYYRMSRLEPMLGADRKSAEWRSWRKFAGEYWQRIALGLSTFAFGLLGAPLGLVVRRGSRAQALVLALFVALPVYYPLALWGDNMARQDLLAPSLALNLGNLVMAAAGLGMVVRLCSR